MVGSSDLFAVLEGDTGADEGNEVGSVHGSTSGLGILDELERHSPRTRPCRASELGPLVNRYRCFADHMSPEARRER